MFFLILNIQVQTEIRKKWWRFNLRREGSSGRRRINRDTSVSYVTKTRGSVASAIINNDNHQNGRHNTTEMDCLIKTSLTSPNSEHVNTYNHMNTNGKTAHVRSDKTMGDVDHVTELNQLNSFHSESQPIVK